MEILYKYHVVMQFFVYLFWLLFWIINYKIVSSDVQKKIIPNTYLLFLLVLGCIWIMIGFTEIHVIKFIINISATFIISFGLYYFWFLCAGDAKYITILCLFIPETSIIAFIANTSLVIIVYLILFIIYVFCIQGIFHKKDQVSYTQVIRETIKRKFFLLEKHIYSPSISILISIIHFINIFLIVFITIRLVKIYLFQEIINHTSIDFQHKYEIHILWIVILALIGLIFAIRYIWKYITTTCNLSSNASRIIEMCLLVIIIWVMLAYEYSINSEWLFSNLSIILSLYILLFFIARWCIYVIKLTFIDMETKLIPVQELQPWDIVRKKFLQEHILAYLKKVPHKDISEEDMDTLNTIHNSVDKDQIQVLKKVYNIWDFWDTVETFQVFAFAPYIMAGCIMSIVFQDTIIQFIWNVIISLLRVF